MNKSRNILTISPLISMIIIIIMSLSISASAEDGQDKSSRYPNVEERLRALEDENTGIKDENTKLNQIINELQRRIDALEKKQGLEKAEKVVEPEAPEKETVLEKVKALEKEVKELKDRGLPSLKGERFKLGGELELEFVKTEKSSNTLAGETDRPDAHFQLDKFNLKPRANLADDIYMEALLCFKTDEAKISEAYAHFSDLPLNSFLRVGLDDRFIELDRKTEGFPLLGTAFWRSDDLGILMGGGYDNLYWRLSLTQGQKLSSKQPSEDASYKLIYEAKDLEGDHNMEKALGLGTDFKLGKSRINLLGFYYFSKLSDDDVAFLQAISGYGSSTDDTNDILGVNLNYKYKGFSLFGQYIRGQDGELNRHGWYIQPSYKFKFAERKRFNALEVLLRYDDLDVDIAKEPTDSFTWDRNQITLAAIIDIIKNTKLKLEYYINDEDTGGEDIDNNEFLMQLEIKF